MEMNTSRVILEVCRTCMNQFSDKSRIIHLDTVESTLNPVTIRQKLEAFAPELDLTVEYSSVVCTECAAAVDFIHKFKKKCLETEEHIQNYIRQFSTAQQSDEASVVGLNDDGSFLKITAVQSLCDDRLPESLLTESDSKLNLTNYNKPKINQLDTSELEKIRENGNQQPHLEIVDFDAVLFNTDSDVEISAEIAQNSLANYTEVLDMDSTGDTTEVNDDIETDNVESSDNNNHVNRNYTIFETFNMVRHKRIMLYKCNDCSYSITHKSSITPHMKSHLKKKSYSCGQCGCKSSLKTDLITHAQNHRKEQPSKCNECNFATAFVSRITIHKKTHKCDKLFSCIKCDYVTQNMVTLKSHLRIHAGDNPNDCKGCKSLILKGHNLKLQLTRCDSDVICLE